MTNIFQRGGSTTNQNIFKVQFRPTKETWLGKLELTLQSEKLSAQVVKLYTEPPKDAISEARGAEEKSEEVLEKLLGKMEKAQALVEILPSSCQQMGTFHPEPIGGRPTVLSKQAPSVSPTADAAAIRSEAISSNFALGG